jgi:chaperonin GroES
MAKKEKSIKILGSRLLVEVIKPDEKSAGGVLLPGSALEGNFKRAVVKVLGEGTKMDDGTVQPPIVKVGDTVLLPASLGTAMELDGQKLTLINEVDIIGVMK